MWVHALGILILHNASVENVTLKHNIVHTRSLCTVYCPLIYEGASISRLVTQVLLSNQTTLLPIHLRFKLLIRNAKWFVFWHVTLN